MQRVEEYGVTELPKEDKETPLDNEGMNVRDATGNVRWVAIARNAYENSTDYFDNNIRKQIEKNINLFHSKHPAGSKYHTESYKFRSKRFRPKTRSMVRRHEASAALAFFSTSDSVACSAEDTTSKHDVMGAEFAKNLINYRLEHSIPWFLTIVGGYQDAMTTGAVVSRQEWLYSTKKHKQQDPVTGEIIEVETVEKDKPDIQLLPTENFRFDPACDWRDPCATSPYLIELVPMYIMDVKERMTQDNDKTGEKKWKYYSDGVISSATHTGSYDSTRNVREGNRTDSKDVQHETGIFDIVWIHRNIVRIEGDDYLYYTLGTEHLLSDPVPVTDVFLHGRPYAIGYANIETHKVYPAAPVEMTQDIQGEANDIANQRLDNVKLVLNKRYLVKRNTNVDFRALSASVPGGIVLTDELNDIKESVMTDVTGSSYQEQDRINVDFDELAGSFGQASVQTNRSLNETVGGMNMMQDDSNMISEYQLRIYTETWVDRVLKQLLLMEVNYETDRRILEIAAGERKQEAQPQVGPDGQPQQPQQPQEEEQFTAEMIADLIAGAISVRVGVGFGATSPFKRIEKMSVGLDTLFKFSPAMAQDLDGKELSKEIFGALGFRDGSRFFKNNDRQDPRVADLQQQLQELQRIIETKQIEQKGKIEIENIRQHSSAYRDQMKNDHDSNMKKMEGQLEIIQQQVIAEKNDIARGELILEELALKQKMQLEEIGQLRQERDHVISRNDRAGDLTRSKLGTAVGNNKVESTNGDGLVNDKGSTVMENDNYGKVPLAEG